MEPGRTLWDLLGNSQVKRKVFVSYHHGGDQFYYDQFAATFASLYDIISDNSLARPVDSTNTEYVIRRIRENHITGSSCTIVLCGAETPERKYVDWEIKATLDKQHGLIGINLPTNPANLNGNYTVPSRLYDNIQSGYALWLQWENLGGTDYLRQQIEIANARSANLIDNSRALKSRNG